VTALGFLNLFHFDVLDACAIGDDGVHAMRTGSG
jgi:hypothetical protein